MSTKKYTFEVSVASAYIIEVELPDDANLSENLSKIEDELQENFTSGSYIAIQLENEAEEDFEIEIDSIDDIYEEYREVRTVHIEDMT